MSSTSGRFFSAASAGEVATTVTSVSGAAAATEPDERERAARGIETSVSIVW
jgi:hypothetical protein